MKVLILFAHPALEKSRVNRVMVTRAREIDGVAFHDLYEAYPDLHIDVSREQALLEDHEFVVFHHPMFWYSTPAILKEWQDLVLEHGWAYGTRGTALRGKRALSAITTGGRESAYSPEGFNRHTIADLLLPIAQTVRLCGMEYLPHYGVHGTHAMQPDEIERHGREYRSFLEALRDDRVDWDAARRASRVNAALDEIILPSRGAN